MSPEPGRRNISGPHEDESAVYDEEFIMHDMELIADLHGNLVIDKSAITRPIILQMARVADHANLHAALMRADGGVDDILLGEPVGAQIQRDLRLVELLDDELTGEPVSLVARPGSRGVEKRLNRRLQRLPLNRIVEVAARAAQSHQKQRRIIPKIFFHRIAV